MRLGVYDDNVYRRERETVYTDRASTLFVAALADRLDEVVLFGRLDPQHGRFPYPVPANVRFVPLPHYARASNAARVLAALPRSIGAFAAELPRLDAVLLFGPHPTALAMAATALRRGTPIALGVRQDLPAYTRSRHPEPLMRWTVWSAAVLERAWRRLARSHPTIVVGRDLGRAYGEGRNPVLSVGFSLVRDTDLAAADEAAARSWDTPELRLLSVGRLDTEKNPLLLPEILAALLRRDSRWRLDVVGTGRLADTLLARAETLGVREALDVHGYVPSGPELWQRYRSAHAFLHVSLTEGLPQVLFEAHAAGIPIVATAVGGVPAALAGGAGGLLVPPRDAPAAAAAVERLRDEPELRARLIHAGLASVREETLDVQIDRVARFLTERLALRRLAGEDQVRAG